MQAEYSGVLSRPSVIPVRSAAPGSFVADGSGQGQIAALRQDYSYSGSSNSAPAGSVIIFLVTGTGQTSPAGVDGLAAMDAAGLPPPAQTVSVTVPEGLVAGDQPIVVRVGGIDSPPGTTVSVT